MGNCKEFVLSFIDFSYSRLAILNYPKLILNMNDITFVVTIKKEY